MNMSKLCKSLLAKRLACPAYVQGAADPTRMAVFAALHEQVRLERRLDLVGKGWKLVGTERPIENEVFKGRIDDLFSQEGTLAAVEYVCAPRPALDKFWDAGLSAAYLRHEEEMPTVDALIGTSKGIVPVPESFIENSWLFAEKSLLQHLEGLPNPASGMCGYRGKVNCGLPPPEVTRADKPISSNAVARIWVERDRRASAYSGRLNSLSLAAVPRRPPQKT